MTTTPSTTKASKVASEAQQYEYSSREISPPSLLLQQIKQAHHIFALHHGHSLTSLYTRLGRDRHCGILERFWTRFARTWDVLLHGNPAVDVLAGIKLASGGELGIGAGEEDWGSGERCVLEEFVHQTGGLVDAVVARFGDPVSQDASQKTEILPWIGAGSYPSVSDGIIFGGVGGITRQSLQSISLWMRQIYTYGEHAYGVRDNPSRERRRRKRRNVSEQITIPPVERKAASSRSVVQKASSENVPADSRPQLNDQVASQDHVAIPPPIVSAAESALNEATRKAESKANTHIEEQEEEATTLGIPDQYVKYLTFGLSTFVKPTKARPPAPSRTSTSSSKTLVQNKNKAPKNADNDQDATLSILEPMPDGDAANASIARQKYQEDRGYFVIGLKGDLDSMPDEDDAELTEGSVYDSVGHRTVVRTVHVTTLQKIHSNDDDSDETLDAGQKATPTRLRVLIYVHRPFVYCFLFDQHTSSLSYASFYKNIHHNLMPIHKPLLQSTQASKVAARIDDANAHDSTPGQERNVYDLLFDPLRLTVHASVPNIPDPGSLAAEGILSNARNRTSTSWTRLDALNVHNSILNTLHSTTRHKYDLERTSRTNRNWWVVWMKLPASDTSLSKASSASSVQQQPDPQSRIAIIVRKAVDSQPIQPSTSSRAASGMWSTLMLRSGDSTPDKVVGLSSGGIGFDARKYIEGLLSLNR